MWPQFAALMRSSCRVCRHAVKWRLLPFQNTSTRHGFPRPSWNCTAMVTPFWSDSLARCCHSSIVGRRKQWDWKAMPRRPLGCMYSIMYQNVKGMEALQNTNAREVYNMIMKKASVAKDEQKQNAGVARYYSTNIFLMEYVVRNIESMWNFVFWVTLGFLTGRLLTSGKLGHTYTLHQKSGVLAPLQWSIGNAVYVYPCS